jgi:GTP cyclohydrolase II
VGLNISTTSAERKEQRAKSKGRRAPRHFFNLQFSIFRDFQFSIFNFQFSIFNFPFVIFHLPFALCRLLDAKISAHYTFTELVSGWGRFMTKSNANQDRPCAGVERMAEADLPTEFGLFRIIGFKSLATNEEFPVLVKGTLDAETPALVRIHSQCLTGDVFHSLKCDCGRQLDHAMALIQEEGRGVIIYQQQEGRGIGITNKIRAYELQDAGQDTVEANLSLGFEADLRQYECCVDILKQLGLRRIRLMSNNPDKIAAVQQAGIEIVERVSIEVEPHEKSLGYLKTKKEKLGHLLNNVGAEDKALI